MKRIIILIIQIVLGIGMIAPSVLAGVPVSSLDLRGKVAFQENAIQVDFEDEAGNMLQKITGGKIEWPFKVDPLDPHSSDPTRTTIGYVRNLLIIMIVFLTIVGVIFGLRIIFIQWIAAADRFDEDALKKVKQNAWRIAIGWGALVLGLLVVYAIETWMQPTTPLFGINL